MWPWRTKGSSRASTHDIYSLYSFVLLSHSFPPLSFSVKGLKGRLTEYQHKLHQVLDEGKHLLLSVCCPALENQLTLLGEHWLDNTSKVNKELQRLEAILKHWTRSETRHNQNCFLSIKYKCGLLYQNQ